MGADVVPVCAEGRLQAPRLLATVLHRRGGRTPRIPRCHGQVRHLRKAANSVSIRHMYFLIDMTLKDAILDSLDDYRLV